MEASAYQNNLLKYTNLDYHLVFFHFSPNTALAVEITDGIDDKCSV